MMPNDVPDRMGFGPYEVDLHTHELWKHGLRLKLVGQPFEILAMLLARPGELVTREELRARLWPGDTFVDFNHGLNAAVNKLREALSDSAEAPRYIETLPRRGYRFIAEVEQPAAADKQEEAIISAPEGVVAQGSAVEARTTGEEPVAATTTERVLIPLSERALRQKLEPRPRRRWLRVMAAVCLFGAVFFFLAWFSFSPEQREASLKAAFLKAASRPSTPIIPLTDLPDPTSDPAFSPDGNRVAFRREGYAPGTSGIFVKPIGSLQLLQLSNNRGDCCPVWSPNGHSIAFSRFSENERAIYTVPATGGALRKLYSTGAGSKRGDLDWSPDGESIAFVGGSEGGSDSIYLLSLKDRFSRRITQPPLLNRDWGPAFSPDGQSLAFVRTRETGLPENIVVMPASGGEVRVLLTHHNGIVGPPAWAADSKSVLFATGEPALFRVPASGGDMTPVTEADAPAWRPAVSRRGYRLAYQKISKSVSIWQTDLSQPAKPRAHTPVITTTGSNSARMNFSEPETPGPRAVVVSDTGRNEGAQVSPDGKKLAFMSSRSGSLEIWMSDRDGSNAIQLTAMGATGTPHWSPDGRSIAFDAAETIFVVNVSGGSPRPLVQGDSGNLVPNWSRDGKWVYFASIRSGGWQVWKVPAAGGAPIQVTAHGGFFACESRDGHFLYYSKFNMPNPEIWTMPVEGGTETRLSSLLRPETWASWAPVDRGIFFVETDTTGDPTLMFFDFISERVNRVTTLDKLPFWLSATPDGRSVLYEHLDQENSHIVLLENFR